MAHCATSKRIFCFKTHSLAIVRSINSWPSKVSKSPEFVGAFACLDIKEGWNIFSTYALWWHNRSGSCRRCRSSTSRRWPSGADGCHMGKRDSAEILRLRNARSICSSICSNPNSKSRNGNWQRAVNWQDSVFTRVGPGCFQSHIRLSSKECGSGWFIWHSSSRETPIK